MTYEEDLKVYGYLGYIENLYTILHIDTYWLDGRWYFGTFKLRAKDGKMWAQARS